MSLIILQEALRILMRTEYRFFNKNSGFVSNVFYFDEDWQQPNNFIMPEILFWLCDNRKRRGEIGLEGYFSVARIADELQKRGYVRDDICDACSWLLRKSLIEADYMNQSSVDFTDAVKDPMGVWIATGALGRVRLLNQPLWRRPCKLQLTEPMRRPLSKQTFPQFLCLWNSADLPG